MRILLVHNYYKQRGGEDESFDAETAMLRSFGHEVRTYTRHNDEIDDHSRAKVALDTFWNRRSTRDLTEILKQFNADVMHCTNLFPLISPSAYQAANRQNVPVVQSLRNYRHFCLNSFLHRDGQICETCISKRVAISGIRNNCYKKSKTGSTVVAAHNTYHKLAKTWHKRVNRFFTPTAFAREKYVEAGFPASRIGVKPNFLSPDPGMGDQSRGYALFVGRLSPEKGVKTLVETWIKLGLDLPLKIVGSGFLNRYVETAAKENENIQYEGQLNLDAVQSIVGGAKFLVMPSEWYETFGRTIMEAFSRGTPVIASDLGAMSELVADGVNGLKFTAGNREELAQKIQLLATDEPLRKKMGDAARETYLAKYTAEANHGFLLKLYRDAIEQPNTSQAESDASLAKLMTQEEPA